MATREKHTVRAMGSGFNGDAGSGMDLAGGASRNQQRKESQLDPAKDQSL
jgi:hypothetical protein